VPATKKLQSLQSRAVDVKQQRLAEFAAYKQKNYTIPREEFLAIDQADAHDP
jgi:hypothetical protein